MKNQTIILAVIATFACCSVSQASITDAWWHDDGDGAVVCNNWNWNSSSSTLAMTGDQYGLPGQPGPGTPAHMLGWVTASDPLDPTLTLASGVENDAGGAWTAYQVNVVMSVPFTFTGSPSVSNPYNDWFVANVQAPTLQGSGLYAGDYEGILDFSGGTPLGLGDELDFEYAIHFSGSSHYTFTQEMIATYSEVPEPGTLALAGMGGLMVALRARRNSRKAA